MSGEILIYETEGGGIRLDVRLEEETLWLTQADMAALFQCSVDNIALHLKNIYEDGELTPEATTEEFSVVRQEGSRQVTRRMACYNLDAIIAVGYRVKSRVATRFRIWATERLKEYIIKGFTIDDQRLKEAGNDRYFEELLARIRDIRSSEKVFWRKVLDIYATSIDYDPHSDEAHLFFQQVQNQMHWAAHGQTAAEVIFARASADKPDMGVTNYPGNRLLKRDTEIAKNYLSEDELGILNRIVTAYLELAELQALNRIPMTMQDWIERLRQFLAMTGRPVLDHAGTISHQAALQKAHSEYDTFREQQRLQPTAVEQHFIEAEKTLKQVENAAKKPGRKP